MYGQVDIEFEPTGGPSNNPPEITSTPVTSALVDEAYSYDVNATDADSDPMIYSLTTVPSGMTISASTGLISWTPSAAQIGTHAVTVHVEDDKGAFDEQSFTISVTAPITGQTPWMSNQNGTEVLNQAWNYTIGYSFTPQTNGNITKLGGYFNGTKTVYLWEEGSATAIAQVSVTSSNSWSFMPLSASVPVVSGTTYIVAAYLEGSGASYRSSLTQNFPQTYSDILINASVYYVGSGKPNKNVTNYMYGQVDIEFEPTGDPSNNPPVITSTPVTSVFVDEAYSYDVNATDADGDPLTYSLTTAPSGMTIAASTGVISWTPNAAQAGTHAVAVRVEDDKGAFDGQSFNISVTAPITGQTPWMNNQYGTEYINQAWNYTLGYSFTPQINGNITKLGGYFNGTKTVYLWEDGSDTPIAQINVTSSNSWTFAVLPSAVPVTAGTTYIVAAFLEGSGASYRNNLTEILPQTYSDITINASVYYIGFGKPNKQVTNRMYGQVDIEFEP